MGKRKIMEIQGEQRAKGNEKKKKSLENREGERRQVERRRGKGESSREKKW